MARCRQPAKTAYFAEHPLLVGRDCDEVLAFCKTLAGDVKAVRGYLADDLTVVIRKERKRNRGIPHDDE